MVYGAINKNGEENYTNLKKVFDAINNKQLKYNWLITDCICYPDNPKTDEMLSKEYCWLSGEELTDLVTKEEFQWIWAVLSAFDKGVSLSEVLKYNLPYADGYRGFWEKPLTMQHPLAKIEIVPWDSTLTLIYSVDKNTVDDFKRYFGKSQDLEEYIDSF